MNTTMSVFRVRCVGVAKPADTRRLVETIAAAIYPQEHPDA